jgi:small conductance mechanosensitive channel
MALSDTIIHNSPISKIEKIFDYKPSEINQLLIKWGPNLLVTVIIFVIGFWLAKMAARTVRKVLQKSNTDEGLVTFLTSLTSMVLKVLVVITGINQLGIEMTSFVAILGAAGLAVGMAFSGTLSNFAGGVMILAFKPFKVGDTIKSLTETGTVKEILIFNTYLYTADNKVIVLPNGPVANGNIVNYTREQVRRADFSIGINYGNDLQLVKDILFKIIAEEARIIHEPAPFVGVGDLGVGTVQMILRVWVKTDDHAAVTFFINEKIYNEFGEAKIAMPALS